MARKGTVLIEFFGKDNVSRAVNGITTKLGGLKKAVFSVHSAFVAMAGVAAGGVVTKFLVDVNREYGILLAQLETMTGSRSAALGVFADLEKFAASTPFQIEDLTKAFITLKAAGITPSIQMLTRFGDIAASMGGKIDDFAMAVRGALTGETERLKAFQVSASIQGDRMALSFQGHTTVIGRNARELTAYLENLGTTNFAGGMARQAETLDGAISNMSDAFATLARGIGDAGLTADLTAMARGMADLTTAANGNTSAIRTWYGELRRAAALAVSLGKAWREAATAPWSIMEDGPRAVVGRIARGYRGVLETWKRGRSEVAGDAARANDSDGVLNYNPNAPTGLATTTDPNAQPGTSTGNTFGGSRATKSANQALVDQAGDLTALAAMGKASGAQLDELARVQVDLAWKAKQANTPLSEQVQLLEAAAAAQKALRGDQPDLVGAAAATGLDPLRGIGVPPTTASIGASFDPSKTAAFDPGFSARLGATIGAAMDGLVDLDQMLVDVTRNSVWAFGDAMAESFQAIIAGSGNAAEAFKDAMIGAVAGVAKTKGMAELASAFSALGSGFMGHPGALAAFANHMKSAGLWFALAGGASAAGGGASGGGRSGAARDAGRFEDADRGTATITIQGGLLDMSDPRQERALADALENLSGRRVIIQRG